MGSVSLFVSAARSAPHALASDEKPLDDSWHLPSVDRVTPEHEQANNPNPTTSKRMEAGTLQPICRTETPERLLPNAFQPIDECQEIGGKYRVHAQRKTRGAHERLLATPSDGAAATGVQPLLRTYAKFYAPVSLHLVMMAGAQFIRRSNVSISTILKYLVAGAAVYIVVAACGSETRSHRNASTNNGPDAFVNPVPDAVAQSGTACGSCTVSGAVKTISADMDPAQFVGGTAKQATQVAEGPLYVTDAHVSGDAPAATECHLYIGTDVACTRSPDVGIPVTKEGMLASRYFVPAGSFLCLTCVATLSWSGFRPYS